MDTLLTTEPAVWVEAWRPILDAIGLDPVMLIPTIAGTTAGVAAAKSIISAATNAEVSWGRVNVIAACVVSLLLAVALFDGAKPVVAGWLLTWFGSIGVTRGIGKG